MRDKIFSFLKQHRIYIFPAVLVLILVILTSLRISGTSIGVYQSFFYGDSKDPSLIFGQPRQIRSDEWLVNTQMAIAQEQNQFQRFNDNFSQPKDMSLLFDVPYAEWSALFKPQNFSFFILPFEHAFAFKWWFLLFALLTSAYFFCLRMLSNRILLSILFAVIIAFTPFVFWWYLTGTIMVMVYGLLILLVNMAIIEDKKHAYLFGKKLSTIWSRALRISLLTYLLAAFALLLYPPFQIPIAIVVAFFSLGWLLKTYPKKPTKKIIKKLAPVALSFVIAIAATGAIAASYIMTRGEAIHAITNTVYPGERLVLSGGYDVKKLLVTYLQPQLQDNIKGAKYDKNQSESSNFIITPLFLTPIVIAFLAWLYIKKRRVEWVAFFLALCSLLFFAQLFVPGIESATKIFLLHLVPIDRLIIGLGFLTFILLVYLVRIADEYDIKMTRPLVVILFAYAALFFAWTAWAGFATSAAYPEFVVGKKPILFLSGVVALGLTLLLLRRYVWGALILAVFSLSSVVFIHPLYAGLGPVYKNEVSRTMESLSNDDTTWAAAEHIYIENLPQMSGNDAVTGIAAYPDIKFWEKYSEMPDDTVYNRYAHNLLSSAVSGKESLKLIGPDFFVISPRCDRKVSTVIQYVVSISPLNESCNKLIKTIRYPAVTFYIYKRQPVVLP